MYKKTKPNPTTLNVNTSYTGERIEEKVQRIVNNKEPITDGAPQIYTERKDGVLPEYDIRTDRFEIAIDAMDKIQKSNIAKREKRIKEKENIGKEAIEGMEKEDGKPKSADKTAD